MLRRYSGASTFGFLDVFLLGEEGWFQSVDGYPVFAAVDHQAVCFVGPFQDPVGTSVGPRERSTMGVAADEHKIAGWEGLWDVVLGPVGVSLRAGGEFSGLFS